MSADRTRQRVHELGRKLTHVREAAGFTQQRLADAVLSTRSTVANVEVGRQSGSQDFWQRCDDVLGSRGQLLAEYAAVQLLRSRMKQRTAKGAHAVSPPVVPATRLAVPSLAFQAAALDQPALDWLLDDGPTGDQPPSRDAPTVTERQVYAARRELDRLRGLDHTFGAGVVHPQVEAFIIGTIRMLLTGTTRDLQLRETLYRVAVGAYELAGYQAVDLGADGLAQRYYLHALELTRRIGDRPFGAYMLGVSLGHLALHCGHPDRGLRMAQAAIKGSGRNVDPAVGAALYAVLARAYARLGIRYERSCTKALTAAESLLAARSKATVAPPGWIGYFGPAYLADERAHCLFDLGSFTSAHREVKQALQGVGEGHVRRLAIDSALQASSLALAGQLDEACVQGREAVDFAARTSSARAVQRVVHLRIELERFGPDRQVLEFSDYVGAVLPAAAG